LKNPVTEYKAFAYRGPHFTNSKYSGYQQDLTTLRIIDEFSEFFKFFENSYENRITFINDNIEFVPLIIVLESHKKDPFAVEKI
jgi:hypothetical protein